MPLHPKAGQESKLPKAPIDDATDGRDIYGLTVNYGALKDQKVAGASVEAEPNRSASIKFNERQMRIQAAGLEPYFDDRISKMAMVIRLNQMAAGYTGMSEAAAKAFQEYINNDVCPLIPSRGSVRLQRRRRLLFGLSRHRS